MSLKNKHFGILVVIFLSLLFSFSCNEHDDGYWESISHADNNNIPLYREKDGDLGSQDPPDSLKLESSDSSSVKQFSASFTTQVNLALMDSQGNYVITSNQSTFSCFNRSGALTSLEANDQITSMDMSENGSVIVMGDKSGQFYVWNHEETLLQKDLQGEITCVAVSRGGMMFAAGTVNGDIFVYNTSGGQPIFHHQESTPIIKIIFSPSASLVAWNCDDGVFLHETSTFAKLWSGYFRAKLGLLITVEDQLIMVGNDSISIMDTIKLNKYHLNFSHPILQAEISEKGKIALLHDLGNLNEVTIIEGKVIQLSMTVTPSDKKLLALSRDGVLIGFKLSENYVQVYKHENKTLKKYYYFKNYPSLRDLLFDADGNYFLTLEDNRVILRYYPLIISSFNINLNTGTVDYDGNFSLSWKKPSLAKTFAVYHHDHLITKVNSSIELLGETAQTTFSIINMRSGIHYFSVLAKNLDHSRLSDCVKLKVTVVRSFNQTHEVGDSFRYEVTKYNFEKIEERGITIPGLLDKKLFLGLSCGFKIIEVKEMEHYWNYTVRKYGWTTFPPSVENSEWEERVLNVPINPKTVRKRMNHEAMGFTFFSLFPNYSRAYLERLNWNENITYEDGTLVITEVINITLSLTFNDLGFCEKFSIYSQGEELFRLEYMGEIVNNPFPLIIGLTLLIPIILVLIVAVYSLIKRPQTLLYFEFRKNKKIINRDLTDIRSLLTTRQLIKARNRLDGLKRKFIPLEFERTVDETGLKLKKLVVEKGSNLFRLFEKSSEDRKNTHQITSDTYLFLEATKVLAYLNNFKAEYLEIRQFIMKIESKIRKHVERYWEEEYTKVKRRISELGKAKKIKELKRVGLDFIEQARQYDHFSLIDSRIKKIKSIIRSAIEDDEEEIRQILEIDFKEALDLLPDRPSPCLVALLRLKASMEMYRPKINPDFFSQLSHCRFEEMDSCKNLIHTEFYNYCMKKGLYFLERSNLKRGYYYLRKADKFASKMTEFKTKKRLKQDIRRIFHGN